MTDENPPDGRAALLRFLRTEANDAGCEETRRLLHVYVDDVLAGRDPEQAHPGIAVHLRTCDPCGQDFEGLLAAARALGS